MKPPCGKKTAPAVSIANHCSGVYVFREKSFWPVVTPGVNEQPFGSDHVSGKSTRPETPSTVPTPYFEAALGRPEIM